MSFLNFHFYTQQSSVIDVSNFVRIKLDSGSSFGGGPDFWRNISTFQIQIDSESRSKILILMSQLIFVTFTNFENEFVKILILILNLISIPMHWRCLLIFHWPKIFVSCAKILSLVSLAHAFLFSPIWVDAFAALHQLQGSKDEMCNWHSAKAK